VGRSRQGRPDPEFDVGLFDPLTEVNILDEAECLVIGGLKALEYPGGFGISAILRLSRLF